MSERGVFRRWAVTWPARVEREFQSDGVKPLVPLSCGIDRDIRITLHRGRKKRVVAVETAAIFDTKREALAWRKAEGFDKTFPVKRVQLKVTA